MTSGAPEPQRDADVPDRTRTQLLRRAAFAAVLMVLLTIGLAVYEDDEPAPGPLVEAPLPLTRARPAADTTPGAVPPADGSASERAAPAHAAADGEPCVAESGMQAEDAQRKQPAAGEPSEAARAAAQAPATAAAGADEGGEAGDAPHADPHPARAPRAQVPDAPPTVTAPPAETRADSARATAAAAEAAATEAVAAAEAAEEAADAADAAPAGADAAVAASTRTEGAPAPQPPPSQPARAQALTRFQLEIGGFDDMAQADRLRDALDADGHASRVLIRVAIGPYTARAAARDALDRLRRERSLRGVLIAAPGGGLLVQVGVFADRGNAERLDRGLAEAGYPVVSHARILLGPYAGRPAADEVATALRDRHGLDVVVNALR